MAGFFNPCRPLPPGPVGCRLHLLFCLRIRLPQCSPGRGMSRSWAVRRRPWRCLRGSPRGSAAEPPKSFISFSLDSRSAHSCLMRAISALSSAVSSTSECTSRHPPQPVLEQLPEGAASGGAPGSDGTGASLLSSRPARSPMALLAWLASPYEEANGLGCVGSRKMQGKRPRFGRGGPSPGRKCWLRLGLRSRSWEVKGGRYVPVAGLEGVQSSCGSG